MPSTTPSDPPASRRRIVVVARADDPVTPEFVAAFEGRPVDVDVRETATVDEARTAVRNAVESEVDAIAAVGGDGALNLVVGTVAAMGSEVPVVSVRAGTVNLMSQVLDLPTPADAARAVLDEETLAIDLGETAQGWFCMNASTGFDAATIGDADDHGDARFGRLRFASAGVRRLRQQSPQRVVVNVDGDDLHDGRAMSVVVMNAGQRVSDRFDVAPDASVTDGLLDVVVVRVATVGRLLHTIARLAVGRPVPADDIVRGQGRRIDIDWRRPVASQLDGDAGDRIRSQVVLARPQAVRVHHGPGCDVGDPAGADGGASRGPQDP